jgi:hypothetical protein
MCYAALRLPGMLLYAIEGLSLQIFLINQRIVQVSDVHPDYDKLKVGQKILWQNKIFHTLPTSMDYEKQSGSQDSQPDGSQRLRCTLCPGKHLRITTD